MILSFYMSFCNFILLTFQHYLAPRDDLNKKLDMERIPQAEFVTTKHGEKIIITKEDTKAAQERRENNDNVLELC